MDFRGNIVNLIKDKTGINDESAKELEVGIYNWCIGFANSKMIIKNWMNQRFYQLYIEKARSVISNIDKNSYIGNVDLIERIKKEEFPIHEVASMKPEEMHPDMWKDVMDEKLTKLKNAYEKDQVAMTDMFKCGKCKQRKCSYYERQVRSADEPSTIFVKCVVCGNGWRIG